MNRKKIILLTALFWLSEFSQQASLNDILNRVNKIAWRETTRFFSEEYWTNQNRKDASDFFPQKKELLNNKERVFFADIIGIDPVITEVSEIVSYLKDNEKYRSLGARIPCGFLLEGPPGCGKTMIAKAIATEANCYFNQISASSFIEKYVGTGAARVRELFTQARKYRPSILFIDEFDAVAGFDRSKTPGDGSLQEHTQTINQLLTELDGFDKNSGLVVIAATNNSASLDPAVKRSGRFDRIIHVPLPDENARFKLLEHYLKKLPALGDDITDNLCKYIAQETNGLCAADFNNMVNEMAFEAVREPSTTVCARHVEAGAKKVITQRKINTQLHFKTYLK